MDKKRIIMDGIEQDWLNRGVFVHPTARIYGTVEIGNGVEIGPYVVIGDQPQIKNGYKTQPIGKVKIGAGTVIKAHAHISSGSFDVTEIGENCFIMGAVHIGHDCKIGNNVILTEGAKIAGEVHICDYANIGLGALIHQGVLIPAKCMIGMGSVVTKKAAAQMRHAETWAGNPARKLGMNRKWLNQEI